MEIGERCCMVSVLNFKNFLGSGYWCGTKRNSIIINMLDKNIDISIISEVTGRLIKDIEEIKKSYKSC